MAVSFRVMNVLVISFQRPPPNAMIQIKNICDEQKPRSPSRLPYLVSLDCFKTKPAYKAAHEVFFIYMVLTIIFHFLRSDDVRLREDQ